MNDRHHRVLISEEILFPDVHFRVLEGENYREFLPSPFRLLEANVPANSLSESGPPVDTERELCRCPAGCLYLQEDETSWCVFCNPKNCMLDGCCCPCAGCDPDSDSEMDSHNPCVTRGQHEVDTLCLPCSVDDFWSPCCTSAHGHGSISHWSPSYSDQDDLPKSPQPVVPRCDECGVRPGLLGCSSCPGLFCGMRFSFLHPSLHVDACT